MNDAIRFKVGDLVTFKIRKENGKVRTLQGRVETAHADYTKIEVEPKKYRTATHSRTFYAKLQSEEGE